MQIEDRIINNILAVRNDRFGEFLLNIPALRALKETYSNARITAVIDPYVKELAESMPFIDEIIEWKGGAHSFLDQMRLVGMLKRKNIDIAVILNPSKELNILTYLAGIPIRVGYNRKWGFLLNYKIEDKKYLGEKHEIEYNLELVNLVGAKTKDKTLSLEIDYFLPDELNIENGDNLIALHPWTSDPIKQWPIDNFCELAEEILKELNVKLVIIGGREELSRSREFFSIIQHDRLINLTGKTTLEQLAAVLKKCKLLISGDSGPVHLASCVGTPVIALFRSDIPGKSAKRWGPWGEKHAIIEKPSLCDITTQEVLHKVREVLKK